MIRSETIEDAWYTFMGCFEGMEHNYKDHCYSIIGWYNQRLMLMRDQVLESIATSEYFQSNFHNICHLKKQTWTHRLR